VEEYPMNKTILILLFLICIITSFTLADVGYYSHSQLTGQNHFPALLSEMDIIGASYTEISVNASTDWGFGGVPTDAIASPLLNGSSNNNYAFLMGATGSHTSPNYGRSNRVVITNGTLGLLSNFTLVGFYPVSLIATEWTSDSDAFELVVLGFNSTLGTGKIFVYMFDENGNPIPDDTLNIAKEPRYSKMTLDGTNDYIYFNAENVLYKIEVGTTNQNTMSLGSIVTHNSENLVTFDECETGSSVGHIMSYGDFDNDGYEDDVRIVLENNFGTLYRTWNDFFFDKDIEQPLTCGESDGVDLVTTSYSSGNYTYQYLAKFDATLTFAGIDSFENTLSNPYTPRRSNSVFFEDLDMVCTCIVRRSTSTQSDFIRCINSTGDEVANSTTSTNMCGGFQSNQPNDNDIYLDLSAVDVDDDGDKDLVTSDGHMMIYSGSSWSNLGTVSLGQSIWGHSYIAHVDDSSTFGDLLFLPYKPDNGALVQGEITLYTDGVGTFVSDTLPTISTFDGNPNPINVSNNVT
jgi:hypothetical protein